MKADLSPGPTDLAQRTSSRQGERGTIIFDVVPGNPDNDLARHELTKLEGVTIREFVLPPGGGSLVQFPLIRDREGAYPRAQGLEEIRAFVAGFLDLTRNGLTAS